MLNKNHVLFNDLCRKYYIRFWEQICQLLKKGELQFVPEVQIHFERHFTSWLKFWGEKIRKRFRTGSVHSFQEIKIVKTK